MKANELRIGNYVRKDYYDQGIKEYDSIFKVTGFVISELDYPGYIEHNDERLEPIILTEEWLSKFGFEKYDDAYYHSYKAIELCVQIKPISVGLCLRQDYVFTDRFDYIEYVHQLQNLYFALTNQELEIKE